VDILGFEATMAFMLEAAFIGVMLFGWHRVSKRAHLSATAMVAFGASLSAFWIMVANSWMQSPAGGELRGRERNAWSIDVPYLLSLLNTRSLAGQVRGPKEFPPEDRLPVLIPFYSFRIMVAIGFLLLFLMLWTAVV
jgi:cytochrome bd-type quinol oxidase subunit 1